MPETTETKTVEKPPDPLWEHTQLDGQSVEDQARVAITHALAQIRDNPVVGYHLNVGSQTFALLTEVLSRLSQMPVRVVRERFVCRKAVRVDAEDRARLDWLQVRMLGLPNSYGDLIGLPGRWTSIREAIDDALAREGGDR